MNVRGRAWGIGVGGIRKFSYGLDRLKYVFDFVVG